MIKIKLVAKMWALGESVTDNSVGRKWGLESKHQFVLCCGRGPCFAPRSY